MRLSTAVNDFLTHLRIERRSPNTLIAFDADLSLLVALARVKHADSVLAFTPELVAEYFFKQSERNVSMATLYRRRTALASFARWGLRKRLWATNPMDTAPTIRKPHSLPKPFNRRELDRLMALTLSPAETALRAPWQ